ncbi:hypothetical protein LS70_008750 [Helicobacter sp. MIT 11-5569]|jgi:hypothetical protein|uniref:hypothetical protein n=2 Tax=Helicobacteraceae TaxID=72293 RepID=UPI00051FB597|nr:hypothetical protein [Helicobacter sp. MIT 11-5569]TLD80757.1 hypothetical protein LS70_008750 [Helicobacter sp. MIT 11-5569]
MSDKELENKILELESYINEAKKSIEKCEKTIKYLKDIVWDRQSKKESSKMHKVLENTKPYTMVKSNVGDIKVDKEFMEKETKKHLNNPNLRGMVTTEEMLSFPKVAKNVDAEIDKRINNYTWRVKANDESILRYGSREYEIERKNINRLLTNHSETEYGERQGRGEQGQLRREFNDRDFLRPATNIIPQENKNKIDFQAKLKEFSSKKSNAPVQIQTLTMGFKK